MAGNRWAAGRIFLLSVALTALAACTTAVGGAALPAPRPATTTTTPASGGCVGQPLPDCLMALPAGSAPWSQMYAPNGAITIDQFLDRVYAGVSAQQRASVQSDLAAQGLLALAHQAWHANSDDADVVLLRFSAPSGADSRNAQLVHAYVADTADYRVIESPQLTALGINAVAAQKIDGQGTVPVIGFYAAGPVAMEFFFWSLATVDQPTLVDWITQQAHKLGSG